MTVFDEILEKLKVILTDAKQDIADNNGWDMGDVGDIFKAITLVVVQVEDLSAELGGMTSEEKKRAAVETLNWLINIPVLPEWLEGNILSVLIEVVVLGLNKFLGDNWILLKDKILG